MQHPDEGTIHAWLDGALGENEAAAVQSHVDECPACAERVREARGLIAGATRIVEATDWGVGAGVSDAARRGFARRAVRSRRRRFFGPVGSAAAAVLLVAAGTLLVARQAAREPAPERATPAVMRRVAVDTARSSAIAPPVAPQLALPYAARSGATAQKRVASTPAPMAGPQAPAPRPTERAGVASDVDVATAPAEQRAAARAAGAANDAAAAKALPARTMAEAKRTIDTRHLEGVTVTGLTAERVRDAPSAARDAGRERAPSAAAPGNALVPRTSIATVVRCYELVGDSLPAELPRRLVLEPGGIVRGADGAVVPTATWREPRPAWTDVELGPESDRRVLHIIEVGGEVRGLVERGGVTGMGIGVKRCE